MIVSLVIKVDIHINAPVVMTKSDNQLDIYSASGLSCAALLQITRHAIS